MYVDDNKGESDELGLMQQCFEEVRTPPILTSYLCRLYHGNGYVKRSNLIKIKAQGNGFIQEKESHTLGQREEKTPMEYPFGVMLECILGA